MCVLLLFICVLCSFVFDTLCYFVCLVIVCTNPQPIRDICYVLQVRLHVFTCSKKNLPHRGNCAPPSKPRRTRALDAHSDSHTRGNATPMTTTRHHHDDRARQQKAVTTKPRRPRRYTRKRPKTTTSEQRQKNVGDGVRMHRELPKSSSRVKSIVGRACLCVSRTESV